jgi:hypothetical protein
MASVLKHWVGFSGFLCAVAGTGLAHAQEPDASSATPAEEVAPPVEQAASPPTSDAATVLSQRHEQWQRDYSAARAELLAGHFAKAARLFDVLAASASDPFDRRLAAEQAALASNWSNRRLVLSEASEQLDEAGNPSRLRTTDEISILYTNAAAYGIGSGIALAAITEPSTPAGAIFPTLAIAGTTVGAVAIVDGHTNAFKYGVPQSMVSGMYIGLEEGVTWVIWNQARVRYDEEWKAGTVAALIWGSATLGAGVGAAVGSLRGTTPGRASFVGSSALWTGTIAGLVAGAFGKEDDDTRDDHAMLGAAIGVNAGAVAGLLAAGTVSPSIARVRYLDLGAVGGGLVFGGVYVGLSEKNLDSRALMATAAVGAGVGLATTWFLTRHMPRDLGPDERRTTSFAQSLRPTFVPLAGGGGLYLNGTL